MVFVTEFQRACRTEMSLGSGAFPWRDGVVAIGREFGRASGLESVYSQITCAALFGLEVSRVPVLGARPGADFP